MKAIATHCFFLLLLLPPTICQLSAVAAAAAVCLLNFAPTLSLESSISRLWACCSLIPHQPPQLLCSCCHYCSNYKLTRRSNPVSSHHPRGLHIQAQHNTHNLLLLMLLLLLQQHQYKLFRIPAMLTSRESGTSKSSTASMPAPLELSMLSSLRACSSVLQTHLKEGKGSTQQLSTSRVGDSRVQHVVQLARLLHRTAKGGSRTQQHMASVSRHVWVRCVDTKNVRRATGNKTAQEEQMPACTVV